jgi:hypothetical protein
MNEYYIGWHQPVNGVSGCRSFDRSMISVNRLLGRKSPFPVNNWILDSGAFTRISSGKGHLSVERYASEVNRWTDNGNLVAAVCQDYMCEPFILAITGLSIEQHQLLTVQNYDRLIALTSTYIMPVIQGYEISDYLNHLELYQDRLAINQWVGVGSVCKRNSNAGSIESILIAIKTARPDLKLHGFGIKTTALQSPLVWDLLHSADSQAHGLSGGKGSKKYQNSNDPSKALEYANNISRPSQLSIFSQNLPTN